MLAKLVKALIPNSIIERLVAILEHRVKEDITREWFESTVIPIHQQAEARASNFDENMRQVLGQSIAACIVPLEQRLHRMEVAQSKLEQSVARLQLASFELQKKMMEVNTPQASFAHDQSQSGLLLRSHEYCALQEIYHAKFSESDSGYRARIFSYVEGSKCILDVGCGSGDFLSEVKNSFPSADLKGIDCDPLMVDKAVSRGIDCELGDAATVLSSYDNESFDTIFMIHLVEHVDNRTLRAMIDQSFRALRHGGRLCIETPNTQSLYTMTHYYYIDPTHQPPRHPSILKFTMEQSGFKSTSLEFLSAPPMETCISGTSDDVNEQVTEKLDNILFSAGNNILLVATK